MDTITYLPLTAVRESPFNPRKSYPEAELEELAESIRTQGVLQPILVRPIADAQQDIAVRYEAVFGHRRFRASQRAALEFMPAIIREMTDEEAAIAQAHENAKRKDITAMEEADSYTHLHKAHKLSAEAIAKAIGKSKSYVYGRLKMAKMAPEVRTACIEQGLSAEIALEVARLPDHNLQRKMLGELRAHTYGADGKRVPTGWVSVREAKMRLQGAFDQSIKAAPFDPADSLLAPRAGACTTCTRRAGNDPDLVDVLDADICTDKSCYQIKVSATIQRRVIMLREAGHQVIEGDKAMEILPHAYSRPRDYMPLNGTAFNEQKDGEHCSVSYAEALERLGKKAPKPTYVRSPHTGELLSMVTDDQAEQVLKALGQLDPATSSATSASGSTPRTAARAQEMAAAMASWSPAERAVSDVDALLNIRRAVLGSLATLPRTADELRMLAVYEYNAADGFGLAADAYGLTAECEQARARADEADEEFSEHLWWITRLMAMAPDEAARLLVGLAVDDLLMTRRGGVDQEFAARKVRLAEAYGVDPATFAVHSEQTDNAGSAGGSDAQLDMIAPAAAARPTPSTATRAGTGANAKGVRYRCPDTGSTWSGRGLKPRWLAIALQSGKTLADFEAKQPNGSAGDEQMVDAGSAGGSDAQADAFEVAS